MKNPKVIVASRLFTPEVGAAAFRLQALARGLVSDGARVRVVTTRAPRESAPAEPEPELIVSRFPVLRDAGGNVRGYLQYLSFDIPLFFRLLRLRADIVVSEPPPTTGLVVAVTCWLRRRPYVYYAADIWTEALAAMSAPRLMTELMRAVEGHVLRHAAIVMAISEGVAGKVADFGVDPHRLAEVGNGVDTSIFAVDGPLPAGGSPVFVYSGTMSEWQGISVFIDAMPAVLARHPNAQLRIFGQGSAEDQLRKRAAALAPDSILFGGIVPPAEAASWLRSATAALVSIVPNQGYDFAKPTKIYAAAACGAPVIFAGTGAGADLVSSAGLGYNVDYDAESVAQGMLQAIGDEDLNGQRATRLRRASWVAKNASLEAAGRRAAAATLGAI